MHGVMRIVNHDRVMVFFFEGSFLVGAGSGSGGESNAPLSQATISATALMCRHRPRITSIFVLALSWAVSRRLGSGSADACDTENASPIPHSSAVDGCASAVG